MLLLRGFFNIGQAWEQYVLGGLRRGFVEALLQVTVRRRCGKEPLNSYMMRYMHHRTSEMLVLYPTLSHRLFSWSLV